MVLFDAHDDFVQSGTQDPLACCRSGSWMQPSKFQISAKLHQMLPFLLTQRGLSPGLERCEIVFDLVHGKQRFIPAAFQCAGDQAIGRVDGVILPAGVIDPEARLLQRQFDLPPRG